MASSDNYFRGVAYWAKVQNPDPKFGNYTLDLYLDADSMALLKKTGLQLKIRESEHGTYVKFKRTPKKIIRGNLIDMGKPHIYIEQDGERVPFSGNIGNGSDVLVKVRIYDTPKGPGHELEGIVIESLVPYEGGEVNLPSDDVLPF